MILRLRDPHRRRRGTTLLEFTLAVPFMLVLIFMAIDVGRIVIVSSALHEAVTVGTRAGARQGLVGSNPAAAGETPCLPPRYSVNIAYNAFCDVASRIPGAHLKQVQITSPTTTVAEGLVCQNGAGADNLYVTMQASADISLMTPGLSRLLENFNPTPMPGSLYAAATARCEVARR